MTENRLVHLVDDDDAVRRSVAFMLKTSKYRVETYENGQELLKQARHLDPGAILLDIRMPGMDGLEVQQALKEQGVDLPVIIMTGHGDIQIAVQAMKAGAVEFIEKPFERAQMLRALDEAFARLAAAEEGSRRAEEAAVKLKVLTAREREVLDGLARGLPNKTIAFDLGISPRTVEIHRANLMEKLGARSLSEALRLSFVAEAAEPPPAAADPKND